MKNQELEDFFLSDNKSGKKFKEDFLKKYYFKLYTDIFNKYENFNIPFKEKIYMYIHNMDTIPLCNTCGNILKYTNKYERGYGKFCSLDCTNKNKERKEKIKHNNFIKYGVESHNQVESVKQRKRNVFLEKYGVDNILKHKETWDKIKKTNLLKYGYENHTKSDIYKKNQLNKLLKGEEKNSLRLISRLNEKGYKNIEISKPKYYLIMCNKCNSKFEINSNLLCSRLFQNIDICTTCNPIKSFSNIENILLNILNEYNIEYVTNDRKLLNGLEIDIYLPDYNIGIEINGLYWHSDIYKDKMYHYNKHKISIENDIELLSFFEDEIYNKLDIVKSMIFNKCNLNINKIYARKCIIKTVNINEYKNFVNENHIQGYVYSNKIYGLYYNDDLVSLMSFSNKRNIFNITGNNFELVRFCNKKNTNVIGGASKLFNFFIKNNSFNSIISYASIRYSNGNLYNILGFINEKITEPNYYYVNFNKNLEREHRYKYRKSELIKMGYDINKTEREIMIENGYNRIYDAGNYKFIYLNKTH